jgi:hypothetical protein
MKTTIHISDGLYNRCKDLIRKKHTSLRALVEEGLSVTVERHENPAHFEFSPVTFGGDGVREEFRTARWETVREEIYKDRGGIDSH